VRTGLVLAGHGGVLPRMVLPFRFGLGGNLGSGRQWQSWITLDDEVGAIRHVIDTESLSGPVNLVSPHPVQNRIFTKALGHVLHRPTFATVPARVLRLALGREMAGELLLASQRVAPDRLLATGYQFRHEAVVQALEAALRN
jgi:hypothetical protein